MKGIALILLSLLGSVLHAQEKMTIDSLKMVDQKKLSGELIEYHFSEFPHPVFVEKKTVLETLHLFTTGNPEEVDAEQVKKAISLVKSGSAIKCTASEEERWKKETEINLMEFWIGESICFLMDQNNFSFDPKGPLKGKRAMKAAVITNYQFFDTQSIKFFVDGKPICDCPPRRELNGPMLNEGLPVDNLDD